MDAVTERTAGTAVVKPATSYRWWIVGLLFVITTVNYMDRNLLGVLKPTILGRAALQRERIRQHRLRLQHGVRCRLRGDGRVHGPGRDPDRVGGGRARLVPGLRGAWPGCIGGRVHGCADHAGARRGWQLPELHQDDRHLVPGERPGAGDGGVQFGQQYRRPARAVDRRFRDGALRWQTAFYVTGLAGIVWVVFWFVMYRAPEEHPKVSPSELAYIHSDPDVPLQKVPWAKLFAYKGTWVYIIGGVLTNPVWWFYNNWVPSFLFSKFNVNLMALGLPLVVIYLMTDVGSIGGGWLSGRFIRAGVGVFNARKLALLACAACTVPVFMAPGVESIWAAVLLIGLAMAAHQGFSANLFTLVSDTMPKNAVAGAVGLGGCISSILGGFSAVVVGRLLDATGNNYTLIFFVGASAYVVAVLAVHLMLPRQRRDLIAHAAE